jgi:hypothetical protein
MRAQVSGMHEHSGSVGRVVELCRPSLFCVLDPFMATIEELHRKKGLTIAAEDPSILFHMLKLRPVISAC